MCLKAASISRSIKWIDGWITNGSMAWSLVFQSNKADGRVLMKVFAVYG